MMSGDLGEGLPTGAGRDTRAAPRDRWGRGTPQGQSGLGFLSHHKRAGHHDVPRPRLGPDEILRLGSCLAFGPIPQERPEWSPLDQGKALTPLVEFPSLQDQGLQIEPESGSEF
jgi:hypothetical protein